MDEKNKGTKSGGKIPILPLPPSSQSEYYRDRAEAFSGT